MTKQEWKKVSQIRIQVVEEAGRYSYPIKCPRWLYKLLEMLEY